MGFQPPAGPRCRVITDNDYCGDPDGLVQLVHQLLSPSADLRAVIGSHLVTGPERPTADLSYERVTEVLSLMGREVPAYAGSNVSLADPQTPRPSAGAEAIVAEAMRTDTGLPLYVTLGGGLTELASAYLMEPRIADRLTAIWIGGPEYPGLAAPPPDTPGVEYNLNIDLIAAQVVFASPIPLWQVPRNAYRQTMAGMAELAAYVRPAGKIGAYLYDSLCEVGARLAPAGLNLGETYLLGDSPLVLLSTLRSNFHPDTSSSRHVLRPAPRITEDGGYEDRPEGRPIRVYTDLDVRLMLQDFYAKLTLQARNVRR
ncbi:Inosine-uridine nucleoside N-ribohydrolase [Nonomuraea solani]|uniref:Inosine-uridine nucleoside N-ribohydrolase n=1 Tax=Nonomuraea solani TaxID=1144553 RepID=A0A1H6EWF5_9ACTN|nr:nucleoside hydrolase [Nonomuraea solani]SEH02178.1 Inosine-uridine nucleoside N-ribohydrolase [Nonomuraea solani]